MKIFGEIEAQYFINSFGHSLGDAEKSIDDLQQNRLGTKSIYLSEGTNLFIDFRDCLIRETERALFLSSSFFRRSFDLLMSSSASLAHMTLYYGSWYASHALIAMFGCYKLNHNYYIEVHHSSPGRQVLAYRKFGSTPTSFNPTYTGSHEKYWAFFYETVKPLIPIVDIKFRTVLSPPSSNPVWQTQQRNLINYNLLHGIYECRDFESTFDASKFPICLSGPLGTQYQILKILIELAFFYAKKFNINSDALAQIGRKGSLTDTITHLIYTQTTQNIVEKNDLSYIG